MPADIKSAVNPMLLSHGTLVCRNLADSRRFYEESLGLEGFDSEGVQA
jgi:catechol 2,3-dioxygenase-like lactoylglutathione lyase family enzyme